MFNKYHVRLSDQENLPEIERRVKDTFGDEDLKDEVDGDEDEQQVWIDNGAGLSPTSSQSGRTYKYNYVTEEVVQYEILL